MSPNQVLRFSQLVPQFLEGIYDGLPMVDLLENVVFLADPVYGGP